MNVTITFLVVGALFVLVLFWVLRSGRIREKYVALWGLIGVAGVVLAIWPGPNGLIDFIVARILDQLSLPQQLLPRWGEPDITER